MKISHKPNAANEVHNLLHPSANDSSIRKQNGKNVIKDLRISSGQVAALVLHNNIITLNNAAYKSLLPGESESIIASYKIIEVNGAEIPQTAFFTVVGTEDDPIISRVL